jgi:hypothetical protein
MSSRKVKRSITRQNLEKHGVYYHPEVEQPSFDLPEHVDAVREILLTFDNTVPKGALLFKAGWEATLQDEAYEYEQKRLNSKTAESISADDIGEALSPPPSAVVPIRHHEADRNDRSLAWRTAENNMKSCHEVATRAGQLGADAEEGWTQFWRRHTFTITSEKAREQPGFQ